MYLLEFPVVRGILDIPKWFSLHNNTGHDALTFLAVYPFFGMDVLMKCKYMSTVVVQQQKG